MDASIVLSPARKAKVWALLLLVRLVVFKAWFFVGAKYLEFEMVRLVPRRFVVASGWRVVVMAS